MTVPGAGLREAGILPFRDGREGSLSPTWSGTQQRETKVPSTPEADPEEDGFPLLSRSGLGGGREGGSQVASQPGRRGA